ncbi:polysaccharide pyruvyl transferase family protein [Okeanomitos corallinicola TIOX110]|uniref:Polysaccharide pyruvyl transferase family protein n=1 Tax=Okeanomitos corallinicola TIOX110 TaxID=3133117 RepID=A0ABZ2UN82_9CYAN
MNQALLVFLCSPSSILISIYAVILSLLRSVGFIRRIPSSAVILPPAAPGSLGDEAMVVGLVNYLKQKGLTNISLVAYNVKEKYPVETHEYLDMRDFFIYRKWYGFLGKFIAFGYRISQYERFYCLGADLMDGYYSDYATFKRVKMVEMAAKLDLISAILGFSYNRQPTQVSVKVLHDLPSQVRLYARDIFSYQRLITEIPSASVNLVADLAFLLSPIDTSEKVDKSFQWIETQRNQGKKILGINVNNLLISKLPEQTTDTLVQSFVDSIIKVSEQNTNLSFMFLPHDFRNIQGNLSDDKLANKIIEKLPMHIKSSCFKIPFPCQAAELKAIVKYIDYVISSRMHLAIACLGQETPVACVSYQDKFAGLYQHFDLEPPIISPTELFEPNSTKLVDLISNLIQKQDQLKQQIKHKLPDIKKISMIPID